MLRDNFWDFWLNSTVEFIFLKDLDGKYVDISKSLLELMGFENKEDVLYKNDFQIYPEDLAKVFVIQDETVIKNQETLTDSDWIFHKKLNKKILIETVKSPLLDENGNIIGIAGVSRDITKKHNLEQQISEQKQRMQAVLDGIPAAIWIKDNNNCFIMVNKAYEEFYGVNKNDLSNQGVSKILRTKKLFDTRETNLLNLQDTEVTRKKETKKLTVWTSEENKRLIEVTKSPIMANDGTCIGLIGVSYDITRTITKNNSIDL